MDRGAPALRCRAPGGWPLAVRVRRRELCARSDGPERARASACGRVSPAAADRRRSMVEPPYRRARRRDVEWAPPVGAVSTMMGGRRAVRRQPPRCASFVCAAAFLLQPPAFRSGIEVVEIDVSATRGGATIAGLTAED